MGTNKSAKIKGVVMAQNKKIEINLFVVLFEDSGSHVAYCPALNIYGYGNSEIEAKDSFEVCLKEFFEYTINKKTLLAELKSLGWNVKREKKFKAPNFSDLLASNKELRKIMDTKDFRKISEPFVIPAFS